MSSATTRAATEGERAVPEPSRRSVRLAGAIVFLVALALRLAYVYEHHAVLDLDVSRLPQTDNHVFVEWAKIIADGDVLCREQPHAYHLWTREVAPEGRWLEWYGGALTYHQSPLYAYFVAAVYSTLGREHAAVGYVQGLFGALTCLLTFVLVRRMLSLRAAIIAGLLLAFSGGYLFYDVFVLRDGLMALAVVVLALALQRAAARGWKRDWLAAGGALGLFTLAKETGPILTLLTLVCMTWSWRRDLPRLVRPALLLIVGWFAVASPAFVRNEVVGAPTFRLSTRGPEVFVAGNARGQEGVSWNPPTEVMRSILMESNFSLPRAMLLTLGTHRAEPWGYVELLWTKTSAFFNGYEIPNNVNFYLHRAHLRSLQVGFVSVSFLGPAALLGLLLAIPRRRRLAVPYLLLGALTASVIALYVLARFRLQVLPLMAVFAAYSIDWFLEAWARRRYAPLGVAGLTFALLAAWCMGEQPAAYTTVSKNTAVMIMHLKAGNLDQAMRYRDLHRTSLEQSGLELDENTLVKLASLERAFEFFDTALVLPEESGEHHLAMGNGYTELLEVTKRGEKIEISDLARASFRRSLEINPQIKGAHYGLGLVDGRNGDTPAALTHYRDEVKLHPDHGPALRDAGLIRFSWGEGSYPEALQYFERALMAGERDPRVLACAARIAVDTLMIGREIRLPDTDPIPAYDPTLALLRARRALQLAPDDPIVIEHVATVFYANKLFAEAIGLLERLREEQHWRTGELTARINAFEQIRDNPPPPPPPPGDPDEIDPDEIDPDEIDPDEINPNEIDADAGEIDAGTDDGTEATPANDSDG